MLPFAITWDVGLGSNVYVVGNHPDLGAWSPTNGTKLRWTTGNVWTGQVAVQLGTPVEYKFIGRDGAANRYGDAANVQWEPGPDRTNATAAAPDAPYKGKTVFYYTGWTNVTLVTVAGTNVGTVSMQRVGPGRTAGEVLYRADGVGQVGEGLEFVPNGWINGQNAWDNAPNTTEWGNNYYTPLDAFLLQDGQIYNYWPTSFVSTASIVTNFVNSTEPGIDARTIRIYLPRGYHNHLWKRYPVLYLHDGQNVFDPGGTFGSWSADAIATREIGQGRMRETIIVAVDNTTNRQVEYEPPGDRYYAGVPSGQGDAYIRFIAGNVRPTLDVNFRTLNDRRNTLLGGSSMGGLISLYGGYETNLFGAILAMSPAVTRAPNYLATLRTRTRLPMHIYLDTGTDEGNVGVGVGNYWDKPWEAYDVFLSQGYAVNDDLLMVVGVGDYHNEAAWRRRLPPALRYLLSVRDEPNLLAQQTWPPRITSIAAYQLGYPSQQHFAYRVQGATNGDLASGSWYDVLMPATEARPWGYATQAVPAVVAEPSFFRIQAVPAP